jgi:hypothetical protein
MHFLICSKALSSGIQNSFSASKLARKHRPDPAITTYGLPFVSLVPFVV